MYHAFNLQVLLSILLFPFFFSLFFLSLLLSLHLSTTLPLLAVKGYFSYLSFSYQCHSTLR